jgi:hypothetical protein
MFVSIYYSNNIQILNNIYLRKFENEYIIKKNLEIYKNF